MRQCSEVVNALKKVIGPLTFLNIYKILNIAACYALTAVLAS